MNLLQQNIGVCPMQHVNRRGLERKIHGRRSCDRWISLCVVMLALCVSMSSAWAGVPRAVMRVTGVESTTGKELLSVEFSAPVRSHRAFLLHYPERVVVDMDTVENGGAVVPSDYRGHLIKGMRFAQNNPTTSRLVIELNQPLMSVSVHKFGGSGEAAQKIVIDMVLSDDAVEQKQLSKKQGGGKQDSKNEEITSVATMSPKTAEFEKKTVAASAPFKPQSSDERKNKPFLAWYKPSVSSVDVGGEEKQTSDVAPVMDEQAKEKASMKRERIKKAEDVPRNVVENDGEDRDSPATHEKSRKPIIMIDAGHGGKDPGASSGKDGDYEKFITLKYARSLAQALNDTGKYRAKLTRSDDVFILLGERVNIARRAGASMFISIHADSAPTTRAEGLSIYTLSETSSDKETAALAEQENSSDKIGGMDLSGQKEEVADILIDLARRETKNKSMDLADHVVRGVKGQGVRTLKDAHRFAGFKVLKAPDIPSVLVELGFLSTPSEAARLKTADHRGRVVRGIVAGVNHYFGK